MSYIHGKNAKIKMIDLREYGVKECTTFEMIASWGSMHTSKLHTHAGELELCYLVQGRRAYVDGERTCMMHGGNVWCNVPDVPHSSVGRPSGSSKFFCLHLLPPQDGELWCGLTGDDARRAWDALNSLDPSKMLRATAALPTVFEEVFDLCKKGEAIGQENLRLLMRTTFNALISNYLECAMGLQQDVSCTPNMRKLIAYINASDPRQPLEVQEIVKQVGVSASYFVNAFQKIIGETPGQYIAARRIESAAVRLVAGESIKKVAEEYHFDSTQHFTRAFGRYFLEPPRRYYLRVMAAKKERDRALGQ